MQGHFQSQLEAAFPKTKEPPQAGLRQGSDPAPLGPQFPHWYLSLPQQPEDLYTGLEVLSTQLQGGCATYSLRLRGKCTGPELGP